MRLAEDSSSWKSSGIRRRDFRHAGNGPEVTGQKRKRKNTRRWCKGVEGREHSPVIVRDKYDHFGRGCYRDESELGGVLVGAVGRWHCHHERVCENCGKVLEYWLGEACPDYRP